MQPCILYIHLAGHLKSKQQHFKKQYR